MKIQLLRFLSIFTVLTLVASCSYMPFMGNDEDMDNEMQEEEQPLTAEEYYEVGIAEFERGSYKSAIENFEEIERLYPFSKLATKAQVMIAYSYYKNEDYDDTAIIVDNFARLHPGNADISYMYYLKALSYYDRIADVKRDQEITQEALKSLQEITRRFPDSEYARDAKLKIDLVYSHLAGKEMEIGRFYQREGKYLAAVNRFKIVVEHYQNTSHIKEALYRMAETNILLGLVGEARKSAAVLGHNYPDSKWYKYAYRLVEKGETSPVPMGDTTPWYGNIFGSSTKEKHLPKENKTDSWFQKIKNIW